MTGSGASDAADSGATTLTVRQSSPEGTSGATPANCPLCACGATRPNEAASRNPFHGTTRCGARKRSRPIGGAAYGMPRHAIVPPSRTPRTYPPDTRTSNGRVFPTVLVYACRVPGEGGAAPFVPQVRRGVVTSSRGQPSGSGCSVRRRRRPEERSSRARRGGWPGRVGSSRPAPLPACAARAGWPPRPSAAAADGSSSAAARSAGQEGCRRTRRRTGRRGTSSPRRDAARITPRACRSLPAKIAVGASSSSRSREPCSLSARLVEVPVTHPVVVHGKIRRLSSPIDSRPVGRGPTSCPRGR